MAFDPNPRDLDFHILLTLLWFSFFVIWFLNNYFWNKDQSTFLQKLMSFMILFKFAHCLFQVTIAFAEPDNTYYVWFCHTSTYVLFNSILYPVFLLISQGFGLYKTSLSKKELSVTVLIMVIIYAWFSVYSLDEVALFPLFFIFLATCGYFVLKFAFYTTKCLKLRYELLQISDMRDLASIVVQKLKTLRNYIGFVTFHFAAHFIPSLLIFSSYKGAVNMLPYERSTRIFSEICELLSIVFICFLFRSKNRGDLYNQEAHTRLNYRSVLPIYEARLLQHRYKNVKENLVSRPLMILNPSPENKISLFIGIPIISENLYEVSPDEVLIQPLLSDVH